MMSKALQAIGSRASTAAPFLVAVVPVLYHWGRNYGESQPIVAAAMLSAAVVLAGAVLAALIPVIPAPHHRAAGATVVVILLAFYGYAFNAVWKRVSLPRPWMLHVLLGAVLLGAAVSWILWLRKGRRDLSRVMKAATLALGMVCALSTVEIVKRAAREKQNQAQAGWNVARTKSQAPIPVSPPVGNPARPDIYYIILDMYAREDVLKQHYNFDNSAFLDELRRRGFTVADRSCANYSFTMMSLASSLNMTYLEGVGHSLPEFDANRRAIYGMTHGNRVSRFLQSQGYRYATNLTYYEVTGNTENADVIYSLRPPWIRGEFVEGLMVSTAACLLRPSKVEYHHHALQAIHEAARLPGPKFVFWHFLLPHAPFVFDRHGNVTPAAYTQVSLNDESRRQPFVEQLMFTNTQVLKIVDDLVKNSPTPPVIILQSDHGPSPVRVSSKNKNEASWVEAARARMSILNACYVPEPVRKRLYPGVTSVNTFRILLSELFGADLPLLEDRCYFGRIDEGTELDDVTERLLPR
jgi:hypothetical protein